MGKDLKHLSALQESSSSRARLRRSNRTSKGDVWKHLDVQGQAGGGKVALERCRRPGLQVIWKEKRLSIVLVCHRGPGTCPVLRGSIAI